jgi:hypothetical protein
MPRYVREFPGRPAFEGTNPFTGQPMKVRGRPSAVQYWEAELRGLEVMLARGFVVQGAEEREPDLEHSARWTRTFGDRAAAETFVARSTQAREAEGFVAAEDLVALRAAVSPRTLTSGIHEQAAGYLGEVVELTQRPVELGLDLVPKGTHTENADLITALFRHSNSGVIRRLEVWRQRKGRMGFDTVIDALAEASPPSLEEVFLGKCLPTDEFQWMPLGNCEPLFDLPLRKLIVQGANFGLGYVDSPTLSHLEVRTIDLRKQDLTALLSSSLPSVTTLGLFLGDGTSGDDELPEEERIGVDDLEPLLNGGVFPALRHLALQNTTLADKLCEPLLGSRLLPRLSSLDLSLGTLSDRGAATLAAGRSALSHLERLDVRRSLLSPSGVSALNGLARQVRAEGQRDRFGVVVDE